MQGLSATQIMRIWERGVDRPPLERALTVLAEAQPEANPQALGALPIGARDKRLMALREATFGPEFCAVASCAACGERIEMRFQASSVRSNHVDPPAPTVVETDGLRLRVRAVTTADLVLAAVCPDAESARRLLAERCAGLEGGATIAGVLDDDAIGAVEREVERVDPNAVCALETACPACRMSQEYELDIAQYLWIEIEVEAERLLRDVHIIARAYGWPEADILAMTPLRRRAYLELLG